MKKFFTFKNLTKPSRVGVAASLIATALIVLASLALYGRTVTILTESLKDRLLSISITAAANIDARDLEALQTESDWQKPEWARVVGRLHRAKYSNRDVVFLYILRRAKDNPSQIEFVADADSIDPYANLSGDPTRYVDANRDGKIEPDGPDKLQWPGQPYPEASNLPEVFLAYEGPVTNDNLYTDSFGTVLTGYAPIKDASGQAVAVLATDIKVDDFLATTRQTSGPFILFTASLLLIILVLAGTIIYSWEKHRHLRETSEDIYRHSLELAVKNKTLALLEKLYHESISVLLPKVVARKIVDTIRHDLNLEFSGILLFDKTGDALVPLVFSETDRLVETLRGLGFRFSDVKITNITRSPLLNKVVYGRTAGMADQLEKIWNGFIKPGHLARLEIESNIKVVLVFPLLSGEEVLGVLLLGMNREYETLNAFEKASVASFINVIALSLDKAYLYQNLQDANETLRNLVKQRESLVHLVTHKVKGAFTHSKYVFASILDGSFGEVGAEIKKWVKQGLESDNRGIETIDLVLNAANLEKGVVKYDMHPFDFKQLVLEIASEKKIPAEAKGLKLETEMMSDSCSVSGDAFWLKEALNNLVDNAVKYTLEGKITVGLTKKSGSPPDGGAKVLFYVRDTGVGITKEDEKNLFTEGGRGKDSIKMNVDSTGYGLYSVKLIVEAHQGRVWMERNEEDGRGSVFFLELKAV